MQLLTDLRFTDSNGLRHATAPDVLPLLLSHENSATVATGRRSGRTAPNRMPREQTGHADRDAHHAAAAANRRSAVTVELLEARAHQ